MYSSVLYAQRYKSSSPEVVLLYLLILTPVLCLLLFEYPYPSVGESTLHTPH